MIVKENEKDFTPKHRRVINGIRRIRSGIWFLSLLFFCVFLILIVFSGHTVAIKILITIGILLASIAGFVHILIWIIIWVLKGFWKQD